MMTYYKWLLGALGFFLGRTVGAIIGFGIGSLIDSKQRSSEGAAQTSDNHVGPDDVFIVLAATIIKLKKNATPNETRYFKSFISKYYGSLHTEDAMGRLKYFLVKRIDVQHFAEEIGEEFPYRQRLRFFEFYYGLAASDNEVSADEHNLLLQIARGMQLSRVHYEQIRHTYEFRFSQSEYQRVNPRITYNIQWNYSTLGVAESATNAEIKQAYRKLILQYHPDRNTEASENERQLNSKKYLDISAAYENLKKLRNIK